MLEKPWGDASEILQICHTQYSDDENGRYDRLILKEFNSNKAISLHLEESAIIETIEHDLKNLTRYSR